MLTATDLVYLSLRRPLIALIQNKDGDGSQKITGEQLGDFYKSLAKDFPIVSIEDPFDQVIPHDPSDGLGVHAACPSAVADLARCGMACDRMTGTATSSSPPA